MTYIAGDYWESCDLCGKRYRHHKMRTNWKNQRVCPDDFEPRHPQEFVRGRIDRIAVPVARPWGPFEFLEQSITDPSQIDFPQTTTSSDSDRIVYDEQTDLPVRNESDMSYVYDEGD